MDCDDNISASESLPSGTSTAINANERESLVAPVGSSPAKAKPTKIGRPTATKLKDNNDYVERAVRGGIFPPMVAGSVVGSETSEGTLQVYGDKLVKYVKMANEGKLERSSVWDLGIVEKFRAVLHHPTRANFIIAGPALSTCSKVYAMKVDTTYEETLRTVHGINANCSSDHDEGDGDVFAASSENLLEPAGGAKKKRKAKKKYKSTVVPEDQINGECDLIDLPDPVLARMQDADFVSKNQFLQSWVPFLPDKMELCLMPTGDEMLVEPQTEQNIKKYQFVCEEGNTAPALRPMLNMFCDNILPEYPNLMMNQELIRDVQDHDDDNDEDLNLSNLEFQFDENVEPPDAAPGLPLVIISDAVDQMEMGEGIDIMEVDEDDSSAIMHVSEYRETMEPSSSKNTGSEYAYAVRPSELTWAGPSHWKPFQFNKTTKASKAPGSSGTKTKQRSKKKEMVLDFGSYVNGKLQKLEEPKKRKQTYKLMDENTELKWRSENYLLPKWGNEITLDKLTHFYNIPDCKLEDFIPKAAVDTEMSHDLNLETNDPTANGVNNLDDSQGDDINVAGEARHEKVGGVGTHPVDFAHADLNDEANLILLPAAAKITVPLLNYETRPRQISLRRYKRVLERKINATKAKNVDELALKEIVQELKDKAVAPNESLSIGTAFFTTLLLCNENRYMLQRHTNNEHEDLLLSLKEPGN